MRDKNKSQNLQQNIKKLIIQIAHERSVDLSNLVFIGGSKGAFAAFYYGLLINEGHILAGAPPICLDFYIDSKTNNHASLVEWITPKIDKDFLHNILLNQISENTKVSINMMTITNDVYFLPYYKELESKLKSMGIKFSNITFIGEGHSAVPSYLFKWVDKYLKKILDSKE